MYLCSQIRLFFLMRKTKWIVLFLLVLLYRVDTMAYTRLTADLHHFVSIDGALGYSSLLNDSSLVQPGNGTSAHIGFGYRMLYNNFLFSTGLEMQYLYNAFSMGNAKLDLKMIDTEADPFTLHVDASDGKDWVHSMSINIPLLIGSEFKRFYFLAGPKLSLNVWNQTQATSKMVTTATYDRYIEDFENMPHHSLGEYDLMSETERLDWEIDVMAHLEVGMRLGNFSFETGGDIPKPKQRFYIALYADYGLLNLNASSGKAYRLGYEQPSGEPLRVFLTPALMSKELSGVKINQFTFGVKATILFELPKKGKCVMCEL